MQKILQREGNALPFYLGVNGYQILFRVGEGESSEKEE